MKVNWIELFIRLFTSPRCYIIVIAALGALAVHRYYDKDVVFCLMVFCAIFLLVSFICYLWNCFVQFVSDRRSKARERKETYNSNLQLYNYVEDVYTMLSERERYVLYYAIIVGEPAKEYSNKFLVKHCNMAHMIRSLDTILNKENRPCIFRLEDPFHTMSMDVVYYIHGHLIELAKRDIEEKKLTQKKIESYFFKSAVKQSENRKPAKDKDFQVLY